MVARQNRGRERPTSTYVEDAAEDVDVEEFDDDEDESDGFNCPIALNAEGREIWFHDSESGPSDTLLDALQEFLATFRPNEYFMLETSFDCSKPRLDAYGGGAFFITATKIESFSTSEWLGAQAALWQKEHRA